MVGLLVLLSGGAFDTTTIKLRAETQPIADRHPAVYVFWWNGPDTWQYRIDLRAEGGFFVSVECDRVLCVAGFNDAPHAHQTFRSLVEDPTCAQAATEIAVLIVRAQDGRADVVEAHRGEQSEESMDVLTSLVVGLFAPPLILSEAIEDGYGDVIKRLTKLHETGGIGVPIGRYLPRSSSAIVALSGVPVSRNVIELLDRVECSTMVDVDADECQVLELAIARSQARPRQRASTSSE